MAEIIFLPPARKYFKKLKDKKLKKLYEDAINELRENPEIGERKTGDLNGIYCYDIYYNRTNYELAYRINYLDDKILVIIMAGTRENYYNELRNYLF
ncbi:MAG: type II toxin-antitoxin system RelE/ParE family toxin [Lachnospiraceae bacterium]|nr:type II toxin-antitoxin system RelE/ParE family toxin [Lachnospiraceae bacterium]